MRERLFHRWKLAFKTLPLVASVALAKVILDQLGWGTISLNPLYSGLVAGNVFLLGFLLAGTLADYKESEKLPGDLAASAETIADECLILCQDKKAEPARQCLEHIQLLACSLQAWLRNGESTLGVLDRIQGLNAFFLEFEPLTQPNFIVRLKQEQNLLRRMVIRIKTIRDTSFVGAGYLIAEVTSVLVVVALVLANFAPFGAELFLLCTITFLLSYMVFLIKDLDDPFEYDADGKVGAAEVSLQPLDYLEQRIARDLRSLKAPAPA